jgi:hypothetical protein
MSRWASSRSCSSPAPSSSSPALNGHAWPAGSSGTSPFVANVGAGRPISLSWRTSRATAMRSSAASRRTSRTSPCSGTRTSVRGASERGYNRLHRADVAELVDAHGSGPCGRKPVEVQVLSSALDDSALGAGFSPMSSSLRVPFSLGRHGWHAREAACALASWSPALPHDRTRDAPLCYAPALRADRLGR